jgi:hypothetical protein
MGTQQALIEQIRQKQLILTVTAGRTGTAYLHNLFRLFPGIDSVHEDEPSYVHVMRRVQTQPAEAITFLTRFKFPVIAACKSRTYAETSHLFCKGFLEPMISLGIYPDLMLLRRNPRSIALSLLERNTIPGRTSTGTDYLLCPSDPNTLPLPLWEGLTDYQLCFWYALEVERRQQRYGDYMRQLGSNVCDYTANELHSPDRFIEMANTFSLEINNRDELLRGHNEVSQTNFNMTPVRQESAMDIESSEQEVWGATAFYEPLLRQRVMDRYRDDMPDPGQ